MTEQIVTDDDRGIIRKPVQIGKGPVEVEGTLTAEFATITDCADLIDCTIGAGLQVDQNRSGEQCIQPRTWRCGSGHRQHRIARSLFRSLFR